MDSFVVTEQLLDHVRQGWAFQYVIVATPVLLFCEYFSTLNDEVRLIWTSRTSLAKFLFCTNRYVPIVTSVLNVCFLIVTKDPVVCTRAFFVIFVIICFQYIISGSIMSVRIYAMWGRNRTIRILLATTLFLSSVVGIAAGVQYLKQITPSPVIIMGNGCTFSAPIHITWIVIGVAIVLFFQLFCLILLLIKIVNRSTYSLHPFLREMFRDGAYYYLVVLLLSTANISVIVFANGVIRNILIPVQSAFQSIVCNRLLLRTRGAYESINKNGLLVF